METILKIPFETANLLKNLAEKYESPEFLEDDPSQFLRFYKNPEDAELLAFVTSLLSFGSRKAFIPKINFLRDLSAPSIKNWIFEKKFYSDLKNCTDDLQKKFYRFYSYADLIDLFEEINEILQKSSSFGKYFHEKTLEMLDSFSGERRILLQSLISSSFKKSKMVSKGKNSANKRINMFLRWMVRSSCVDLGLWSWWSKKDLIIPLDVHVLEESKKLGLISKKSGATLKTALLLTKTLEQIWPDDPVKGDFALFGLGV